MEEYYFHVYRCNSSWMLRSMERNGQRKMMRPCSKKNAKDKKNQKTYSKCPGPSLWDSCCFEGMNVEGLIVWFPFVGYLSFQIQYKLLFLFERERRHTANPVHLMCTMCVSSVLWVVGNVI